MKRVDALSCIFEGESPVESQPFALDSAFRRLRAQHDALAARFDILQSFFVDQYGASHPQLLGALELAATSGADVQSSASAPNVTADNGLEDMTFESPEDPVNVLSNVLDGSTPIADAGIPSGHTTVYRDPALYETYTGLFSIDEVLARILNLMPRRDVAKVLITRLLSPEEVFLYGTFIEHIFLKDVDEFWRYIEAGDIKSVDPAMIACVLEAVAGGVELVALDMVDVCGIPMANLEALQPQWRRAASQALELADWMNVPSYRCLQYCLLRGHPGLSNGSRPFYHAYAVRLARSMGFHKLGTDQMKSAPCSPASQLLLTGCAVPPNSPGLPSGVCASKRQLACRAWATLYSIDVESSLGTGDWLIKSDSSKNATAPPLNVADADIGSQIVLQPRSMEDLVQGGCSALRLRYAVDMRKFVDGVIGLADAPDMPTAYARIRQIDAQFRDSVGRFNHLTALSRSPHLRNGLVSAFHVRRIMFGSEQVLIGFVVLADPSASRVCVHLLPLMSELRLTLVSGREAWSTLATPSRLVPASTALASVSRWPTNTAHPNTSGRSFTVSMASSSSTSTSGSPWTGSSSSRHLVQD